MIDDKIKQENIVRLISKFQMTFNTEEWMLKKRRLCKVDEHTHTPYIEYNKHMKICVNDSRWTFIQK